MDTNTSTARNLVLGIDPGVWGGLTFLDPDGDETEIFDVPVLEAGTRSKRVVDESSVWSIINRRAARVRHAFIERVGPMPKEGAVGAFSFGMTTMALRMSLVAAGIPWTPVEPAVWKRRLSVPASKDGAAMRANQLMPKIARHWAIKRLECNKQQQAGRCESALIAYYGNLKLSPPPWGASH